MLPEYQDAQQDADTILFFDGKSLRMELVDATVTRLSYVFHR